MVIDILLICIIFISLTIATISDIKTREVPDWLSYSLIVIAISLKAMHSLIYKELSIFLFGLLGFAIFFVVANLMYYTKQWGGGDAKLLMGLGIIFISYPDFLRNYFTPNLNIPFLLILMLNILIIGAIYGLVVSLFLAIKHKKQIKKELKEILENKKVKKARLIILLISFLLMIIIFLIEEPLTKFLVIMLAIFILILFYLSTFIRAVEKAAMYKEISVSKLTEGDWIVNPVMINKKVVYDPKSLGVTKKQIALIKKENIRSLLVREGIPFVPSLLIATIISLVFGNIIFI